MDAKPQIKIQLFIDGSTEDVWKAITDKAIVSQWLMETNIEPMEGFNAYFKMSPMPGFNGKIEAKVLEVVPFKIFSYSWQGGWMKVPTTIKFTLEEFEHGTNLTLEHHGFEGIMGKLLMRMMKNGWKKKVQIIKKYIQ
jgi:uncharacterized protein YndB with AHSA1/START domain